MGGLALKLGRRMDEPGSCYWVEIGLVLSSE